MAAAQFNNYLTGTLGIADQALRVAINGQGLTTPDTFIGWKDEDTRQICTNIRKPGGQIANPNAALAGQPPMINNPGIAIGHIIEKRLKMLCYYVNHLQQIQQRWAAGTATLLRLTTVYQLLEQDDNDEDVGLPNKLTNVAQARECIENIDDYFGRKRGIDGVQLGYVIRALVALPVAADDPGFGLPSHDEEMVTRAPHTGASYHIDNRTVWDVIRHVTHRGPAYDWVSQFAHNFDGRGAYLALKMHYLGPTFQAMIRAQADKKLDNAFFDGRNRGFSFERYCSLLQHSFTDLE
jgi:hypothetical protein